ncbi:putative Na antiporter C3A11.09 [Golovinomyces cichoracearum]|uniref:Putative Na antiporter C3A11.09 n=1 Tax=Golovinomyces cichoracearum TaxID=62708 RepID=A0A420J147_9PEZI|nr:putative Na antiporter C3A11.09 [Golovinomyces cichoracearum]
MTWDQLSINQPHLSYMILGGFTSLFMLCSSFFKDQLYTNEATLGTLCGIAFGPHGANVINPMSWGNIEQLTLELSRVVLVLQCFNVGVELPSRYVEKHWKGLLFLLIPVMSFGWLATGLIIWWMLPSLSWLDSLCISACVTATDPVLASSLVGKGKFSGKIPKRLRDLLSAESGANDGLAFPFIYLAIFLIDYRSNTGKAVLDWFLLIVMYECVFGCIYGFTIGYIARQGIKLADKHNLIDKESFLVFYFVLALFCAGSASTIGTDELLVGFSAGIGFSNDGWIRQETEESHVSDVMDLLINLIYFFYFGTIIPWESFNNSAYGITTWRLVVIALFVLLFRRIPVLLIIKPLVPDIETWPEAFFVGHFGPIGVGAIFIASMAKDELDPLGPHHDLFWLIWPVTIFLVITSILVHGSSVAVFHLVNRMNKLVPKMNN